MKSSRVASRWPWLLCLLALVLSGCGTADINMHVTYTRQGQTTWTISIESTGMIGAAISEGLELEGLRESGFQVETVREGEVTRQTASVTWGRGDPINSDALPFRIEVYQGLLSREYEFRMDLVTPVDPDVMEQAEEEYGAEYEELINTMVKVSIAANLPGKIISSNADNVQEGTATWYPTWTDPTYPELVARSRDVDVVRTGILAGVLVCIVVIVIVALLRRRKRQTWSQKEMDRREDRAGDPN
ncbi:MAG: hypothetical protein ACYCYF_03915 [Anaerolineae bacterium]